MAKQPRLPETPDGTQPSGAAPAPSYVVGYGLPPAHTRYKPGHRGCGGRPKRQRNVGTVLKDTLDERITIREGKRTRSVSKLDAIILRLVNDAASEKCKSAVEPHHTDAVAWPDRTTSRSHKHRALHVR